MSNASLAKLAVALLAAGLLLPPAVGETTTQPTQPAPAMVVYGPPKRLCNLADKRIRESSGLAASRRTPGVFWTHNDSGDGPRLYAFNAGGRSLGAYTIRGVRARDWEDMASFTIDKTAFLLIADIGDNARRRKSCKLYIVREPKLNPGAETDGTVAAAVTIEFKYADGPRDCESVAVDTANRRIYLASKDGRATIYELPLPDKSPNGVQVAKVVATAPIPFAVAMDMSPDATRAVILSYGPALEFTRRPGETWKQAFAAKGRRLPMPPRRQGESICYGPDGKTLYLTSEKLPTPLFRVPAKDTK